MEIFNPLKQNNRQEVTASNNDLMLEASSDAVGYKGEVPRSPISNEPMQIVTCGSHRGPNFKAWCSIKDRIVIPFREG